MFVQNNEEYFHTLRVLIVFYLTNHKKDFFEKMINVISLYHVYMNFNFIFIFQKNEL